MRACCSSRSTAARISSTIARRRPRRGSRAAPAWARGQLEGPRDGVGERHALGRSGGGASSASPARARKRPSTSAASSAGASPGSSASGAHQGREVEAALGLLDQLDRLEALHDHVEAAVLEAPHERLEPRRAADVGRPGGAGLDDHEGPVLEHAVGVELPVARLEEVQRDLLARQEDQVEGEEPEIEEVVHAPSLVRAPARHAGPGPVRPGRPRRPPPRRARRASPMWPSTVKRRRRSSARAPQRGEAASLQARRELRRRGRRPRPTPCSSTRPAQRAGGGRRRSAGRTPGTRRPCWAARCRGGRR